MGLSESHVPESTGNWLSHPVIKNRGEKKNEVQRQTTIAARQDTHMQANRNTAE